MNKPKVSVIIPVFNTQDYLEECLNSVLSQTLRDIEIICVDDGSTDGSLGILQKYLSKDERIKIINQHKSNAGNARNTGLKIAQGKYIICVDADDYFVKNDALETLYHIAEVKQAQMVIFKFARIQNGKVISEFGVNDRWSEDQIYSAQSLGIDALTITTPAPFNKLIAKHFIDEYNLHFQDIITTNDIYFSFTALANIQRLCVFKKALYHYRMDNPNSLTNNKTKNLFTFAKALLEVRKYLIEHSKFQGDMKKSFLRTALSVCLFNIEKVQDEDKKRLIRYYQDYLFEELEFDKTPKETFFTSQYQQYLKLINVQNPHRIKSHLSYKFGQALLKAKNPIKALILPYTLFRIWKKHKFDQSVYETIIKLQPSLKPKPIEEYSDYEEALKVKKHLSYRLGNALIKHPLTFVFRIPKIYKEFKKDKK